MQKDKLNESDFETNPQIIDFFFAKLILIISKSDC